MYDQTDNHSTVKSNQALSDFIENESFPVDFKDCRGKYIANNQLAASVSGLTAKDRIGLDIHDIGRIHQLSKEAMENMIHADRQVSTQKSTMRLVHTFSDKVTGFVVVDQVIKKPVFDHQDKLVGILSYAQDILAHVDRYQLYASYKHYYSIKDAISTFLTHMRVAEFFKEMPTDLELSVLLHVPFLSLDDALHRLQLSSDEIRSYQNRLIDKLAMIDYEDLAQRLYVPTRKH